MKEREKLITLEEWDRLTFSKPHSLSTLRAWARSGNIVPRPRKIGRQYFVPQTAEYVEKRPVDIECDDPVVRRLVGAT